MTSYYILKTIHIISSTILFGTGLGSAFYFWRAHCASELSHRYFAAKNVVIADFIFTTPAVIIQPISGFGLMAIMGYPMNSPWIVLSLVLYILIGVCWLPVVWLQIRMRDMLAHAIENTSELPPSYNRYYLWWYCLGWPAFIMVIVIFGLMTFKPQFV